MGLFRRSDRFILLISLLVQGVLAVLFGHQYDMLIFMATGYLVANGQNPYIPQNLTAIFHNPAFQGMTSIGYPPPWALVLGLLYRIGYVPFHNLLVYNAVIKLPIIAANVGLAYTVARMLRQMGVSSAVTRKAWIFLMINPLLFYSGSAWGQFDAIVALLTLISVGLLYRGRLGGSAALLALAIAFKPTAIPVLLVTAFYLSDKGLKQGIRYAGFFIISAALFIISPFMIFHWSPAIIFNNWNAQFSVGGGMSLLSILEYLRDSYRLPGMTWLLGLAWIPALLVAMRFLKPSNNDLLELLKKSTAVVLIFFLTRAWLSEQNVILILPFVVLLSAMGELNNLVPWAVSLLPLVFTLFNASIPQLIFFITPQGMQRLVELTDHLRQTRLVVRSLLVIPWQVAGWWIVVSCLKKRAVPAEGPGLANSELRPGGVPAWK